MVLATLFSMGLPKVVLSTSQMCCSKEIAPMREGRFSHLAMPPRPPPCGRRVLSGFQVPSQKFHATRPIRESCIARAERIPLLTALKPSPRRQVDFIIPGSSRDGARRRSDGPSGGDGGGGKRNRERVPAGFGARRCVTNPSPEPV